jgi:hypothetical protein
VSWYRGTIIKNNANEGFVIMPVDRVQTGLRVDKALLKVMKGLAEYMDMSLADLIEGLLLHSLEGKVAIHEADTLTAIENLRQVYGLELTAADSHKNPEPD